MKFMFNQNIHQHLGNPVCSLCLMSHRDSMKGYLILVKLQVAYIFQKIEK